MGSVGKEKRNRWDLQGRTNRHNTNNSPPGEESNDDLVAFFSNKHEDNSSDLQVTSNKSLFVNNDRCDDDIANDKVKTTM